MGGWLALFVASLWLRAVGGMLHALAAMLPFDAPVFPNGPAWQTYCASTLGLAAATSAALVYLALLLHRRRERRTVKRVIAGLWMVTPAWSLQVLGGTLILGIVPGETAMLGGDLWDALIPAAAYPVLHAAIGTLYLRRSRRVAATYPDPDQLAKVFR